MLLLLLVMPVALLLMICMLERYERLIDRPLRTEADQLGSAVGAEHVTSRAGELGGEIGTELAPEAA
ncbi:MAG: hypothetical protein ACJ735_07395 [Actinomycetes bacterium]